MVGDLEFPEARVGAERLVRDRVVVVVRDSVTVRVRLRVKG